VLILKADEEVAGRWSQTGEKEYDAARPKQAADLRPRLKNV